MNKKMIILEAVIRLCRNKSVRSVTHRNVAKEAGLKSFSNVVYHFGSTESLISAALAHYKKSGEQCQIMDCYTLTEGRKDERTI